MGIFKTGEPVEVLLNPTVVAMLTGVYKATFGLKRGFVADDADSMRSHRDGRVRLTYTDGSTEAVAIPQAEARGLENMVATIEAVQSRRPAESAPA